MPLSLRILTGPDKGREIDSGGRASLSVGRSRKNDVAVADATMSRVHARVFHEQGGWFVEDCRSRNGVFVDGKRIGRARLRAGHTLRLGQTTELVVEVCTADEPDRSQRACLRCGGTLTGDARDAVPAEHARCARVDDLVAAGIEGFGTLARAPGSGPGTRLHARRADGRDAVLRVFTSPDVDDPRFGERLDAAVRTASALVHPNIVQIVDRGSAPGCAYVVEDAFAGIPLAQRLATSRFVPVTGAARVAAQLVEALAAAADAGPRGVPPRGLRSADVLVSETFDVRWTALAAPSADPPILPPHDAALVAPEVAQESGDPTTESALVWAVGALLYRMLTGIPRTRATRPGPPSRTPCGIPPRPSAVST